MNYKTLGRTRLKVSELCLGPMTFGENFFNIAVVDQSSANRMVTRALEAGINFLDTADVYSYGSSEAVLGLSAAEIEALSATTTPRPIYPQWMIELQNKGR